MPWRVIRELEDDITSREADRMLARRDFIVMLSAFLKMVRENGYRVRCQDCDDGHIAYAELPSGTFGSFVSKAEKVAYLSWMPMSINGGAEASIDVIERYAVGQPPIIKQISLGDFLSLVKRRSSEGLDVKAMDFIRAVTKLSDGMKPIYLIETAVGVDADFVAVFADALTDANLAGVIVPHESVNPFAATVIGE